MVSIEGYRPGHESLVQAALFFDGVTEIILVSSNERKQKAIGRWVRKHAPIWGDQMLELQTNELNGEEADWWNAALVAQDKVERRVEAMRGDFGQDKMVIGSDVVVFINGEPFHNLSRRFDLSGKALEREVIKLADLFGGGSTEVVWDIVLAFSRPHNRFTVGTRRIAHFGVIGEHQIKRLFWEDVPGALGISTRVPLVRECADAIYDIGDVPLKLVCCNQTGVLHDRSEWEHLVRWQDKTPESIAQLQDEVVGGIPLSGHLDDLARIKPRRGGSKMGVWNWI